MREEKISLDLHREISATSDTLAYLQMYLRLNLACLFKGRSTLSAALDSGWDYYCDSLIDGINSAVGGSFRKRGLPTAAAGKEASLRDGCFELNRLTTSSPRLTATNQAHRGDYYRQYEP